MQSIFKKSIIAAAFVFGAVGISNAQVKVGDNPGTINAGAALEIESTNKGFLPPRLALTGANDATTIPSPATGMIVYNTTTAGIAPNSIVPGLVVNNGTPGAPQWANVQVFSNTVGSKVDKLRYLGPATGTKTAIIDGYYEVRIRTINSTFVAFEIRLLNDPTDNHTVRYNRHAYMTNVNNVSSSTLIFTGGAAGNWNTYQSFDQPGVPFGNYQAYSIVFSSPGRDRLISSILHYSAGEFVNWEFSSY